MPTLQDLIDSALGVDIRVPDASASDAEKVASDNSTTDDVSTLVETLEKVASLGVANVLAAEASDSEQDDDVDSDEDTPEKVASDVEETELREALINRILDAQGATR
jgi:hypothetical protein